MGGMPDRLRLPRLETPRTRVPAGSVGIGGIQCCIYSVDSPGGYWILGRTPLRLYDPGAPDPILLRPGDRVRFRRIDRPEFDAISSEGVPSAPPRTSPPQRARRDTRPLRPRIRPRPPLARQEPRRSARLRDPRSPPRAREHAG